MKYATPLVFLGGTCNESKWREDLISKISIDFFNPVVEDWTEEAQLEERRQREICTYNLYMITPLMKGVYSIAEVVEDSIKRPEKTLFCFDYDEKDCHFDTSQRKSLDQVGLMVERNGGKYFRKYEDLINFLNN